MNTHIKVPTFGKYLDALRAAGVETNSGRGFFGGLATDGAIVVTAWIHDNNGKGRFKIFRPHTNHGRLLEQWQLGNIHEGTEVRLILVRDRAVGAHVVAGGALMEGKWKVVSVTRDGKNAFVEQAA
jgi:hypothetical protein